MAIIPTNTKKGFALLIAVIFVSVVLALATALGSLGYKQEILAQNGARSEYAFYAANAALECALLDIQGHNVNQDPYSYKNSPYYVPVNGNPNKPTCGNNAQNTTPAAGLVNIDDRCFDSATHPDNRCPGKRVTFKRFKIGFQGTQIQNANNGSLCADVTVYETQSGAAFTNFVFAQGYDVPCSKVQAAVNDKKARFVVRGIYAQF